MKKLIASVAAAGLALTPLAAQANTRSAESNVSLSAERIASPVEGAEEIEGDGAIIAAVAVVLLAWAAYEIFDSKGIFD